MEKPDGRYLSSWVVRKIFRISVSYFLALILLGVFSYSTLANDPPHNEDSGISCGECHGNILFRTDPAGLNAVALKDAYNDMCLRCHELYLDGSYDGNTGPKVNAHTSAVTNSANYDFTTSCVDCHHPHQQTPQFWYGRKYYKSDYELAYGAGTANPSESNRTVITYTSLTLKSGWTVAQLAEKTSLGRGAIFLPNRNSPYDSHIIESINGDENGGTITVKGSISSIATAGFAIAYGQAIKRDIPYASANGQPVEILDRQGRKSFAHNDTPGADDKTPNGICQVCHTQTRHWRNDGKLSAIGVHAELNGSNCMDCHPHIDGFKVSFADHTGKIEPVAFCQSCHPGEPVTDIHGLNCGTCHYDLPNNYKPLAPEGSQLPGNLATGYSVPASCEDCHFTGHDTAVAHDHRVTTNLSLDCTSCHAVGSQTAIDGLHNTCGRCHDYSGTQLNASMVAEVISNGSGVEGTDQNCEACHNEEPHHNMARINKTACQTCHYENIVDEHVYSRGYVCDTCHASAISAVTNTINTGKSNIAVTCDNCHNNAAVNPDGTIPAAHHNTTYSKNGDCLHCHVVGRGMNGPGQAACGSCHGAGEWFDPQRASVGSHNDGPAISNVQDYRACFSCHLEDGNGYDPGPAALPPGDAGYDGTPLVKPFHAFTSTLFPDKNEITIDNEAEALIWPGAENVRYFFLKMQKKGYKDRPFGIMGRGHNTMKVLAEPIKPYAQIPVNLDGIQYEVPSHDSMGKGRPATGAGSLQVTIEPPAVVAAGAAWRAPGTNWQVSSATLDSLLPREYLLEASLLPGWASPPGRLVTVNDAETTIATITYEACGNDTSLLMARTSGDGSPNISWSEPLQQETFSVTGWSPSWDVEWVLDPGGATGMVIESAGSNSSRLMKNGSSTAGTFNMTLTAVGSNCPGNSVSFPITVTVTAAGAAAPDSTNPAPIISPQPITGINFPTLPSSNLSYYKSELTHIAGDVYAMLYSVYNDGRRGYLYTYSITADGGIDQLDSLLLSPVAVTGFSKTLTRVSDSVYMFTMDQTVLAVGIQADGTITGLIDQPVEYEAILQDGSTITGSVNSPYTFKVNYNSGYSSNPEIISLGNDIFALAYYYYVSPIYYLKIDILRVDPSGSAISRIDSRIVREGIFNDIQRINGDIYGLTFYNYINSPKGAQLGLLTIEISSDGTIGPDIISSYIADEGSSIGGDISLGQVNGNIYSLIFEGINGTPAIETIHIGDDGIIADRPVNIFDVDNYRGEDSYRRKGHGVLPLSNGLFAIYHQDWQGYQEYTVVELYEIDAEGRINPIPVATMKYLGRGRPELRLVNGTVYSLLNYQWLETICIYNPDQDADGDGLCDQADTCPNDAAPDVDRDGVCGAADICPNDPDNDADGDGVCGDIDNCPSTLNGGQEDADLDGIGDACDACNGPGGDADGDGICDDADACPNDPTNTDPDLDGFCGAADNCPDIANATQLDTDSDGLGDSCDSCPKDPLNDIDGDGRCVGTALWPGQADDCPFIYNYLHNSFYYTDSDNDGMGDVCDPCPWDINNDADGDGVCAFNISPYRRTWKPGDERDNCPSIPNADQADADGDLVGDACDNCPDYGLSTDQADSDGDGIGNVCDTCPDDAANDADGDGICVGSGFQSPKTGGNDNCSDLASSNLTDTDGDGIGNVCDTCPDDAANDADGDGICVGSGFQSPKTGGNDNCPNHANPGQEDLDANGVGDLCYILRPDNTLPLNGATGIERSPAFSASAFSGGSGIHQASQWQISTGSGQNFATNLVYDSGPVTDLESYIPAATLASETTYFWRVRFQDNLGYWSIYSNETSFTTKADVVAIAIAQWKFEEGTGDTAYDSIGSNDGTRVGATWTDSGMSGRGLSYDGINDYVEVPSINGFNQITAELWVKPDYGNDGINHTLIDLSGVFYRESFESAGLQEVFECAGALYGDDTKITQICDPDGADYITITSDRFHAGSKSLRTRTVRAAANCSASTANIRFPNPVDFADDLVFDAWVYTGPTSTGNYIRLDVNDNGTMRYLYYALNNALGWRLTDTATEKFITLQLATNNWVNFNRNIKADMASKGLAWNAGDTLVGYLVESYCGSGSGSNQDVYVDDISVYSSGSQLKDSSMKLVKSNDNNLNLVIKDNVFPILNSKLITGSWNHIVFTVSGSDASMYVNGVKEIAEQSVAYNFPAVVIPHLGSNGVASSLFKGSIDEAALYDRVLTPAEVQNRYTTGGGISSIAPDRPTNSSPSDTATNVTIYPTLAASVFADPDGDSHQASRWQLRKATGAYGDGSSYDSGATGDLTSHAVIVEDSTYFWHVQYQDSKGAWSSWSQETSFCPMDDADGDGFCGDADNCISMANSSQKNTDGDSLGDVCDACPNDPDNDADGDGLCSDADTCPNETVDDADGDGICAGSGFKAPKTGDNDNCPNDPDKTEPGICGCGVIDSVTDSDGDGVVDCVDNCLAVANGPNEAGVSGVGNQTDSDSDSVGDACDICPNDPADDADGDTICAGAGYLAPKTAGNDNCPSVANGPDQAAVPDVGNQTDSDCDGAGDACSAPVYYAPEGLTLTADAQLVTDATVSWEDIFEGENGYRIERYIGTCGNDPPDAVTTIYRYDDFADGIDTTGWIPNVRVQTAWSNTPPYSVADTYGSAAVSWEDGAVKLQTAVTLNPDGNTGYNVSQLIPKNLAGVLGDSDFDMQFDFTYSLTNADHQQFEKYAGIDAYFPATAGGTSHMWLSRVKGGYSTGVYIDGGPNAGGSLPSSDPSGKIRMIRRDNRLAAYAWNGASWQLLKESSAQMDDNLVPSHVGAVQVVRRNEENGQMITTYLDNFRLNTVGGQPVAMLQMDFNENSWQNGVAGEVADSAVDGNHGTPYGAVIADDADRGRVGSFDGTDDYVDLGSLELINTAKPFTVAAWVNLESFSNQYPGIIRLKTNEVENWKLAFTNDPAYGDIAFGSAGGFTTLGSGDIGIATNTWYHVVVIYNGAGSAIAGNYKLYLDGVEKTLAETAPPASGTGNSAIGIEGVYGWHGMIDDVRVYNQALTAKEVQGLYYNSMQFGDTGLTSGNTYCYRVYPFKNDSCPNWEKHASEVTFTTASNTLPAQPENLTPADGQNDVYELGPTLIGSTFSDGDGDSHTASFWQISTGNDDAFDASVVYQKYIAGPNESHVVTGSLLTNTTYYWRVMYQDSKGEWSLYSNITSFIIGNAAPATPVNAAPADLATDVSLSPVLAASIFADSDTGDTHQASQWRIREATGVYGDAASYDSGVVAASTTHDVAATAAFGTTYYWQVRYQDSRGDWSAYSTEFSYTTRNSNFAYRRPITLSPATPAADYQVRVDLNSGNFDYAKVKADGSDITFYNGGDNELSYWVETWNPAGTSSIWVKVPAAGTAILYMDYGNGSASSSSNGSNTFDLYFENVASGSSGFDLQNTDGFIIEASVTANTLATEGPQITFNRTGNGSEQTNIDFFGPSNLLRRFDYTVDLAVINPQNISFTYPLNVAKKWMIAVKKDAVSNSYWFYFDNILRLSDTNLPYLHGTIVFGGWSTGDSGIFHYLFVRKYAASEPAAAVGAEM